ncbi:MAG: cytochrome P450 [Sandaracinaceae bacterium]
MSDPRQFVGRLITPDAGVPPDARLAPMPAASDPILGHLREATTDPLTAFPRWRSEVGDIVRIRLAGMTAHLLAHPRDIKAVLQERHREFSKPIEGRRNLSRLLGNGLLVSEGDFWLRQRRIAQPAFHKKRIDGFAERMIAAATELADEWEGHAARGERFDANRDMMRVTLRIVQETLLGAAPTQDADRIADAVSYLIGEVNRRFRRLIDAPMHWPTPANRRFAKHRAVLDQAVGAIIKQRRERPPEEDATDLLSMLLLARDEETGEAMDDVQLRDEVMTMFLAGHETTANALSWTFQLLGTNPHVARKLRDELGAVLGGRPPRPEDYPRLTYVKQVFQEAMRLYPPAWIMARAPRHDLELGGYFFGAHTRIFVSPWVTHHHPDVWPDPEGFDPERFADPSAIDPFAYFPFGGGRRMCIGSGFAMMEGVLLLATLAQRFHLELAPGYPVTPEAMVTLRPKHGVMVRARKVG